MTPQETDPDLPVSVQESPVEAWVCGGLPQGAQRITSILFLRILAIIEVHIALREEDIQLQETENQLQ